MAKISQKLRNFLKTPYDLDVDAVIRYLAIDDDSFDGKDNLKDMNKILAEAQKFRDDKESQLPLIACLTLEHAVKAYKPGAEEKREIDADVMGNETNWFRR